MTRLSVVFNLGMLHFTGLLATSLSPGNEVGLLEEKKLGDCHSYSDEIAKYNFKFYTQNHTMPVQEHEFDLNASLLKIQTIMSIFFQM